MKILSNKQYRELTNLTNCRKGEIDRLQTQLGILHEEYNYVRKENKQLEKELRKYKKLNGLMKDLKKNCKFAILSTNDDKTRPIVYCNGKIENLSELKSVEFLAYRDEIPTLRLTK